MTTNPLDIAYMKGYEDGTETVAKLTVRNLVLKSMILVLAMLVLYLMGCKRAWQA